MSFIQRKANMKILVCDHARLSLPTKATLISISSTGSPRFPNYLKDAYRQLAWFLNEYKRPFNLCRFPHYAYRKMLVCFAHFMCKRCPHVVLYPVLFLWDHSIQEQGAPWFHVCVFTNPSLRFVYVGYCGVLDHWVYRRENSNKILLFFSFVCGIWNYSNLK